MSKQLYKINSTILFIDIRIKYYKYEYIISIHLKYEVIVFLNNLIQLFYTETCMEH